MTPSIQFLVFIVAFSSALYSGYSKSFQKSNTERKEVMRHTSFTFQCPPAIDSMSASNKIHHNAVGKTTLFFYHEDLLLCLQSGDGDMLSVEDVATNFTGVITCNEGSCNVGTEEVTEITAVRGRLVLKVSYPPTYDVVPGSESVIAGAPVVCPFQSDPPAKYTFMRDRSPDNNCSSSTVCRACNATCKVVDRYERDPAYRQQMCQEEMPCFMETSVPGTVIALRNCYGCLACSATNVINNVRYTSTHRWMVDTTQADDPPCPAYVKDASIKLLPGSRYLPGKDTLSITASFLANVGYGFFILKNGTLFDPKEHNAEATRNDDGPGCWKYISLDFFSPVKEDEGTYDIIIAMDSGKVILNTTVTALDPATKQCSSNICKGSDGNERGSCFETNTGTMYCKCYPGRLGAHCQYACKNTEPKIYTDVNVTVDKGCPFKAELMCRGDIPYSHEKDIVWKRNGKNLGSPGKYISIGIERANYTDTSTYSCYDGDTLLSSMQLEVFCTPILDSAAVNQILAKSPFNVTGDNPVVFPIDSFVLPKPHYHWTPSPGLNSKKVDCIVDPTSRNLFLKDSCSGWYTGTATNNYGSVSFSVNCVVNGDGGSHTNEYIEYGASAAAGFILAVLLICFVFGVRRWMKPKRPHQETGLEQSSESASLLQSGTDGQYHYDGDGSDGHGSLARQGIPTAAAALRDGTEQGTPPPDSPSRNAQMPVAVGPRAAHSSLAPQQQDSQEGAGCIEMPASVEPALSCLPPHRQESQGTTIPTGVSEAGSFNDESLLLPGEPQSQSTPQSVSGSSDDGYRLVAPRQVMLEERSRPGTLEDADRLAALDQANKRQDLVNLFTEDLTPVLRKVFQDTLEQVMPCLSLEQKAQIQSVHDTNAQVLHFVDYWREAQKVQFWHLTNIVFRVVGPINPNLTRKIRMTCEQTLRNEYYEFSKSEADDRDMSTISQKFKEVGQATPASMLRPSRAAQQVSNMARDGDPTRRKLFPDARPTRSEEGNLMDFTHSTTLEHTVQ